MRKDIKILVVDDEVHIVTLLEHILSEFTVETACNGLEAELHSSNTDFDIVITDIHMPKSGGLDVLFGTHDKQNPPEVIVISGGGKDLSYHFEEAEMLGASKTLKKPFTPKEILDVIDEVLIERSKHS